MAKELAKDSPAPAQQAASSGFICSPDGVAEPPDRVCRVARSLESIGSIVNDRRDEWLEFIDTDYGKFGAKEKATIKGLLELYPAEE
jgi:hypothetical protein